jgi:DNA-directed RNA polymerase subunit RPC12/RpoP
MRANAHACFSGDYIMPKDSMNYTCPNCGGPLKFDPAQQKLACEYCGSSFTQEEVAAYFSKKEEEAAGAEPVSFTAEESGYTEEEAAHMRAYSCQSCGARLYTDENTAVTLCPYCGKPTIIPSQFKAKKPAEVLPFQITKDQAVKALSDFYKGKPFLPKLFSSENQIEKIQGVYVPFWLYDATMHIDGQYAGERVRQFRSGDDIITETSHYRLVRRGSMDFSRVPADGSSSFPNDYMDALEPFDYSKLQPFSSSYMAGYLADSYDQSAEENQNRVDERMRSTITSKTYATTAGYSSVMPVSVQVRRLKGRVSYVFMPVWMLSTVYQDKSYLFAVNGQSGKTVGSLPVDKGIFLRQTILLGAILFAAIAAAAYFIMMSGVEG